MFLGLRSSKNNVNVHLTMMVYRQNFGHGSNLPVITEFLNKLSLYNYKKYRSKE